MADHPTSPSPDSELTGQFSRRSFLRSTAVAGAAAALSSCNRPALVAPFAPLKPGRDLQVALVGCGEQGNALWAALSRIDDPKMMPHIRAVVDIDRLARSKMQGNMTEAGHATEDYENIDVLLEKEGKNLDAVILAVPDWIHHELTIKALQAGLHVYCEKMMSNRIEWARDMVRAQLASGKLLQIGHQRRSNPRYRALHDGIVSKHKGLGRLTHAYAQWHRSIKSSTPLKPVEEKRKLALAKKYGYETVNEFRNWRHYRKFGGGIISDLGAHQIDLFNWFFGAMPKRLVAMGGVDYFTPDSPLGHYELPDNVMVTYEYEMPADRSPDGKAHTARGYYQTLTTTGTQGFHERFMGDAASVAMSEVPVWNQIFRESHTDEDPAFSAIWQQMEQEGLLYKVPSDKVWKGRRPWESARPFGRQPPAWFKTPKEEDAARRSAGAYVDVRVSKEPDAYELGAHLMMPAHQPHREP